jgi:hypothetical protein
MARNAGAASNLHVTDVAGDALGATLQEPAGDDARPDPGGDLDEDQVLDLRPGVGALAEGHDVHVVVDEHGHLQVLLHPPGNVEAIPARHDRRVDRLPAGVLYRAREPDADSDEVARVAVDPVKQFVDRIRPSSRAPSPAPLRNVDRVVDFAQTGSSEVGDGESGVRCAQVGREHQPRAGVQGELR